MKKEQFVFKMEKPCHENWNEMDSAANGKFCNSCKKNVFDLTDFSDDELAKIAQKYPDGFCGRLKHDQINKPITHTTKSKYHFPYLNGIAASALTATTLLSNIKVTAQNIKTEIVADIKNDEKKNDAPKQSTEISNKKIYGHVIDSSENGNIGIADVVVKIAGNDSCLTTTDRWGYYELEVPEKYKHKLFKMSLQKVGLEFEEDFLLRYKELPFKQNFYTIPFKIIHSSFTTTGVVCITPIKKAPWWKRIFKKKTKVK